MLVQVARGYGVHPEIHQLVGEMLISRVEPMWNSQRSAMPEREQELDIG
jgi:hypothetical protein